MSRRAFLPAAFLALSVLAQGCASGTKYAWGDYHSTLYAHYRNPQNLEAHLERIETIVRKAESESPDRVPPGMYAEYGYALYEAGRIEEAIVHFETEKARWPESSVLMEKMIRNARRRQEIQESTSAAPAGAEAGR
jgi:hypothetical protein